MMKMLGISPLELVCGSLVFLTKVIKDRQRFLPARLSPDDLQELTDEEREELLAAQARQASCIRRFLSGEERPGLSQKPKFRTATHKLLQAINHAWVGITGVGLERFCSSTTRISMLAETHRAQGTP